MTDLLSALFIVALLCASAGFGIFVSPRLPARHRPQTIEMVRLVIGMLVTFAALLLGLLTASAKADYDEATYNRHDYALQLTRLDQCLRNYGPESGTARGHLESYTAGVIASTWPSEKSPAGVPYPDTSRMPRLGADPALADLLNTVELEIDRFSPAGTFQVQVAESCRLAFQDVLRARLRVIETVKAGLSTPFYRILVLLLMIIFASFGLIAPRHNLSVIAIALCAISLSTAIFVIVDLNHPYDGLFAVPGTSMRAALASMMRP